MSKFKVGDKVRPPAACNLGGLVTTIYEIQGTTIYHGTENDRCFEGEGDGFTLVESKGGQQMGKRTFKQLKESPTAKKGAIWQEECEDGTQPYLIISGSKYSPRVSSNQRMTDRSLVEDQPTWFEEVFTPGDSWFTKDELEAFKKFMKKGKK